jgi:hypothetical protein
MIASGLGFLLVGTEHRTPFRLSTPSAAGFCFCRNVSSSATFMNRAQTGGRSWPIGRTNIGGAPNNA